MTNHPNRPARRGLIKQMMVQSKFPYIVYGYVRGLVSEHSTTMAAQRSLIHDQRSCRSLGGGAYSDATVMMWTTEGWRPADVQSDE